VTNFTEVTAFTNFEESSEFLNKTVFPVNQSNEHELGYVPIDT
jgi:hypothetical protein